MAGLTVTRFNDWLDEYGEAWMAGSPDRVVALFAWDARYHVTPFDEALIGHDAIRQYWEAGPRDAHDDVRFSHDVIAVTDDIGVARWHATLRHVPSSRKLELDGVFLAQFGEDDRCIVLREWWHRREGT